MITLLKIKKYRCVYIYTFTYFKNMCGGLSLPSKLEDVFSSSESSSESPSSELMLLRPQRNNFPLK